MASTSPFEQKKNPTASSKIAGRFLDVFMVGGLLICLLLTLRVSPKPAIAVSSQNYHPLQTYATAAQEQLGSFSDHNKITFDEVKFVAGLRAQFPEIYSASVELPIIGSTPKIQLDIADPVVILRNSQDSYVLDTKGVVVSTLASHPGLGHLLTIDDQTGFQFKVGGQALSKESINFIVNLQRQLAGKGVKIKTLTLPPEPEELDLVTEDQSYYTKFFLSGDVLQQSGEFLAARNHFKEIGNSPSSYLDVRIQGKIFYK